MAYISEQDKILMWIWSKRIFIASNSKLFKLIEIFGSVEKLYAAPKSEILSVKGLSEKEIALLSDKNLSEAQNVYENAVKNDIDIIISDDYRYPKLLKNTNDPPLILYVKGNIECIKDRLSIACVGTRRCTKDAYEKMQEISFELSKAGAVIVSGMASGMDTAAHTGALEAGGITVAVLGTAINRIYPAENRELYYKIIESGGAVISEYPPGYYGYKSDFLRRNRIVAGMSDGVLLCQAPLRSGSITTAKFALDYGRDTFCVAGSTDEINEGSNRLIMDGCAKLILSAEDILCEYESKNDFYNLQTDLNKVRADFSKKSKTPDRKQIFEENKKSGFYENLSDDKKKVVLYLEDKKVLCDRVSMDLNIAFSELGAIITELEIDDILTNDNGYISLNLHR